MDRLGQLLKLGRERRGWACVDVARQMPGQWSRQRYHQIETGKIVEGVMTRPITPHKATLERLSMLLEIDYHDLVDAAVERAARFKYDYYMGNAQEGQNRNLIAGQGGK